MSNEVLKEALAGIAGAETDKPEGQTAKQPADPARAGTMSDALGAIAEQIKPAPAKIPDGKVIVGVSLARVGYKQGVNTENIGRPAKDERGRLRSPDWRAFGVAVGIRNGHVIAGNAIYGRWSRDDNDNPVPKVTACHYLICPKCGCQVDQPAEVCRAKDMSGVKIPNSTPAREILAKWGECPRCRAKGAWVIDRAREKELVDELAARVVEAYCASETALKPFLAPAFFTIGKKGAVPPEWQWLQDNMTAAGGTFAPFAAGDTGDVLLYNPNVEFWMGWADNPHASGLFWVENSTMRRGREPRALFDPRGVNGL